MTSPAHTVRHAELTDLDAVWPLARDLATSFRPTRDDYQRTFRNLLTTPHALLLVASTADAVSGYLLAHSHHTFLANGAVAWVEELMVNPELRGQGVGRALMREAERWAADEGAPYLALATRRAGLFYEAIGYDASATYYKKTFSTPAPDYRQTGATPGEGRV